MSQIAHTPAEPVEATERKAMTPARRARILKRQGPVCARADCEAPWTEIDHIVPLALGGADEDHNCEGLCADHHRQKTSTDLGLIAKAKRRERNHLGLKPRNGPKLRG